MPSPKARKPPSAAYPIVMRAAKRLGSATALAEAAGLTVSAMLRCAKGHNRLTLGAESCLSIAEVSGENPSALLRAAGKGEVADRIERLYGPPRPPLSADERALLALDEETKRRVRELIEYIKSR
jgi:hypothetical protein